MRLGMTLGMTGTIDMALVLEAERLGFTMVWCGESYGTDAVTPITWVLHKPPQSRRARALCKCRRAAPPAPLPQR
jgi:alkanesulfonate monooxygenase SsuD/methylene tetrahydromethanopterin reductase-like flavin-dependent oxidoreductase (luciferase family)